MKKELICVKPRTSEAQDRFNIKLGGFYAQHTSRNANDGGRPTEVRLVDVYGKTIEFNPKGDCLTLTQP